MNKSLTFLWRAIRGRRRHYALMLVAPLTGAFYMPVIYYTIKLMVDAISAPGTPRWHDLLEPLLIYLAADLTLSLTWRLSNVASWRSQPWVRQGIVLDAVQRLLAYRYAYFQNTPSGSLVSKVRGLLDGYGNLWDQLYFGLSYWVLASVASAGAIMLAHPLLGVIVAVWAGLTLAGNAWLARRGNRLAREQGDARHRMLGLVADILGNVQSIKLFASRHAEHARLRATLADDVVPREVRLEKFNFVVALLNDLLGIVFIVAMLAALLRLRAAGLIGIGDFVFVVGVMFSLQENIYHMIQEFQALARRMGDLESSLAVHDADVGEYPAHASTEVSAAAASPSIEFRDVRFAYPGGRAVFDGLNLRIAAGERVGVVGTTGTGKTTLVQLLLKIHRPDSGRILIGRHDIAELDADALRRLVSVMPQDIGLFHRSIRDNIAYGNPNADDDELLHACRRAHVHEFVTRMPQGYDTMVGERGVKLSGGQRQRIAIARALLKDAPILVLDEATSSLDSHTERLIQGGIDELLQGKTVLAIAHRLSTLKDMDRIIVLEHGRIVESGTHDELLADPSGRYARIWRAQGSFE